MSAKCLPPSEMGIEMGRIGRSVSGRSALKHWAGLIGLALSGTLAGILLFLLIPSMVRVVQQWTLPSPARIVALKLLGTIVLLRIVGVLPRRSRDWLDAFCSWVLDRRLTVAVAGACFVFLVTWFPHYLTWPWFVDTEQFAVSALAWDAGLVPYRDLPDFDFPGPIYLCYVLGKTFGWGHTTPFNAIDATFLVLLGIALAAWSRRLFGSMLPGLVGYLPFLCNYLSMDITHVGQRDWHGPFLVILGLLAQQALPGRAGRIAVAFALAAGLAYRPQLVLLLPATVLAVVEGAHRPGEPWARVIRPLGEWVAAFAASLVLVFSPLILHGVLDDFVFRLRVTRYGAPYNQATWQSFVSSLETGLVEPLTLAVLGTGAVLSCAGPTALRGPARTWLLATIGALFYRPISPVQHVYLYQPLHLIRSIDLALPIAWLLATPRLVASLRLAAVAAVVIVVPRCPAHCSVIRSLRALAPLAAGQSPIDVPAGCGQYFSSPGGPKLHYRWEDYRRLLAYLRDEIPPWTRVAGVFRAHPYPPVTGATGHLSTFPSAGGLMHLCSVDPGIEDQYLDALEKTPGSIVVWAPDESQVDPRLKLPRLVQAIRRTYRPEARFGDLEVWRYGPSISSLCSPEASDHKALP